MMIKRWDGKEADYRKDQRLKTPVEFGFKNRGH